MNTPQKIFIETTIQIERVTSPYARQHEIAKAFQGKQIITSTYVLSEYLRVLVKDAMILHELVKNNEHLYDVETAIATMMNKRSASRCLLIYATLHRAGIYERARLLRTLQNYIEHNFLNLFMVGVDELLDSTACGLAHERPALVDDIFQMRTQCTRQVIECKLASLLTRHHDKIQLLAEGLHNHKETALARIGNLCQRILTDPHVARGRNCTWYLGDLVIALEAPTDAAIYTTNKRHFQPLCELLGKQVYETT